MSSYLHDIDRSRVPAHIAIVDIFVDISPNDAWSVGGFSGRAAGGARFVYELDPNSHVVFTAPGTDHRFVTFFSEPPSSTPRTSPVV